LDALPGPNLQTTHAALTFTAQAVDVIVLIGLLVLLPPGRRRDRPSTVERAMVWWAVAFLTLWLLYVGRTVLTTPVPIRRAVYWCMDFASFAALVPLFARFFRDERRLRTFIGTVAIGA